MAAVELHKLNGDTSWLFRLPVDSSDGDARFFNLVVDPWLNPTPQIDGSPLFSRQTRIEPAAFASIAELDQWLHTQAQEEIDAILFSHPFTDHLHPETLTDDESIAVLRRTTIFTTGDSLAALESQKIAVDRAKVINLSSVAVRQDSDQKGMLPEGIAVQHLPARDWAVSPAWTKLHGGILVECRNGTTPVQIVYSPHGITPTSLPAALKRKEQGMKRVLIHSFDRQTLPLIGVVACGMPNILEVVPVFSPDVVLATHDEHKQGEGVVGRLLKRQEFALDRAQTLVDQLLADKGIQRQCVLKQLAPGEALRVV